MDFQIIHVRAVGVDFGADGMPGAMNEILLESCVLDVGTHRVVNLPSGSGLSRAHAIDDCFHSNVACLADYVEDFPACDRRESALQNPSR